MTFLFETGEVVNKKLGAQMRGFQLHGRRPYSVVFSIREIVEMLSGDASEVARWKEYIAMEVRPALSLDVYKER